MSKGYWGNVTANVDWCEPNYSHTQYIAETWNSLSNIVFVAFALFSLYQNARHKLVSRFNLGAIALGIVGIGSFTFHATMLRPFQLFDELPMLYGTAIFVFMLFNMDENTRPSTKKAWIMFLVMYSVTVTVLMQIFRTWYWLFILGYGALVVSAAAKSGMILYRAQHMSFPNSTYVPTMKKLLSIGIGSYALGFVLWNIDNNFCQYVEPLKLHVWWHVFAAIGTYMWGVFTAFAHYAMNKYDTRLGWSLFQTLPYVVVKHDKDRISTANEDGWAVVVRSINEDGTEMREVAPVNDADSYKQDASDEEDLVEDSFVEKQRNYYALTKP